jgi:hypothetical protein
MTLRGSQRSARASAALPAAATRRSAALIERLPALEIIASFVVGYDGIDVVGAAERGVIITNTPDVLTEQVADTALGLLLMTVRELSAAERHLRAGQWPADGPYPLTPSLRDRTVGSVGLGRIGHGHRPATGRHARPGRLPLAAGTRGCPVSPLRRPASDGRRRRRAARHRAGNGRDEAVSGCQHSRSARTGRHLHQRSAADRSWTKRRSCPRSRTARSAPLASTSSPTAVRVQIRLDEQLPLASPVASKRDLMLLKL